jgi:hypothetical protein
MYRRVIECIEDEEHSIETRYILPCPFREYGHDMFCIDRMPLTIYYAIDRIPGDDLLGGEQLRGVALLFF